MTCICTGFSQCPRDFKADSTSAPCDRVLFETLFHDWDIGRYRTSHNCDFAREVEGLHDMLIWGLGEDHFVV